MSRSRRFLDDDDARPTGDHSGPDDGDYADDDDDDHCRHGVGWDDVCEACEDEGEADILDEDDLVLDDEDDELDDADQDDPY